MVGRNIAAALKLDGDLSKQCGRVVEGLHGAFLAKDMSLLEINPLVVTKEGRVICLDAKINFDDSALFRHPDVAALRDPDEEDPTGARGREIRSSPTSSSTARLAAW